MYKYLALHISNKEFAGIANSVDTRRCIWRKCGSKERFSGQASRDGLNRIQ
jgi:hypothetical protein